MVKTIKEGYFLEGSSIQSGKEMEVEKVGLRGGERKGKDSRVRFRLGWKAFPNETFRTFRGKKRAGR